MRAVEAQLSGMAARLENVYATAIDLVSPDDLDTVLDRIVQRAAGEVRATGYALAVRPRPDGDLQVYCHGVDEGAARALVAGAAEGEEASCLRVGVTSSRRTYGELVAVYPDGLDFFAQERRLLQLYAKHAAAVLDMATALDEAAQRHEQVSALLALSNALAHAGTSAEIAARLAEAVPSVVDCDRVGVLIWDPRERQLRHAGGEDAILGDLAIRPGDTPSLERMIDEPQPAFVAPDTDDPFLAEVMARLGAAAMIVVPIVSREEFLGVLTVSVFDRPERLKAGPDLLGRLTGTAGLAATALRNGRLVDALDHRARHDALTGLLDRDGFGEAIDAVLDECGRAGTHAGLLFVDLDGFKGINDVHGHDAGDELLRQAADRLVELVRRDDDVARLGGDEFAVILPEVCDESQVLGAAGRVRAPFAAPFELGPTSVAVSVSVGHSIWPDEGRTTDALVREADAAMYRDKLRG